MSRFASYKSFHTQILEDFLRRIASRKKKGQRVDEDMINEVVDEILTEIRVLN